MVDTTRQREATFDVETDGTTSGTLVVGFSQFGLAGLTAVDYLVTHLELELVGHIRVEGLPAITPFSEGRPRHHTRLYSSPDVEVTVLIGELFVPVRATESFGRAVVEWTEDAGTDEAVVLSGVPVAHGPEGHRTYYIATEDYRTSRLESDSVDAIPMGGGYLDGINGALMAHAMETELKCCVFTTPVHAQAPDAEAALRLLTTLDAVYDLGVDLDPLETFAAEVARHYEELAARMNAAQAETEQSVPEDRMYM